jgi:hypothetical protein
VGCKGLKGGCGSAQQHGATASPHPVLKLSQPQHKPLAPRVHVCLKLGHQPLLLVSRAYYSLKSLALDLVVSLKIGQSRQQALHRRKKVARVKRGLWCIGRPRIEIRPCTCREAEGHQHLLMKFRAGSGEGVVRV